MVNPDDAKKGNDEVGAEEEVPLVEVKTGKESSASGANGGAAVTAVKIESVEFVGLTKEELEKYANDPFWKRLRMVLFILFWAVWLAMLVAVVLIIIISPKCPPRPQRGFWQKPFYRIQVQSFAPESLDGDNAAATGKLSGIRSKLSYLREQLGIDNIMIDSLLARDSDGCIENFKSFNPEVGTVQELRDLTKLGRKKGFTLMMELDVSQAAKSFSDATKSNITMNANGNMKNRAGTNAIVGDVLQTPRPKCNSLNVTAAPVMEKLKEAITYWLDVGLSGFILSNVAFIMPEAGNNYGKLYSNASVQFVKDIRNFIEDESNRLGRPLALFVDLGDTGKNSSNPVMKYARYAHSVLHTGMGSPLSASGTNEPDADKLKAVIEKLAKDGNDLLAVASNWPYLKRQSSPALSALVLTLPAVPILYYGQELGMKHVTGVELNKNMTSASYLSGKESTDATQTPMQWGSSPSNAGWLHNSTVRLSWITNLNNREADIKANNLQTLSSSGHPESVLQLIKQLLSLRGSTESIQWGNCRVLHSSKSGVLVVQRKALRFPSAIIIVNVGNNSATVPLPMESVTAELKMEYAWGSGVKNSYEIGESYPLRSVYVPPTSVLLFVANSPDA